jgi:flagellar FliL protein
MAENEPIQKETPAENADNTGDRKPKRRVWPAVLLLVVGIAGSASAAVVTASVVIRPAPRKVQETAVVSKQTEEQNSEASCEFTLEEPLIVNVYQTQQRRYLSVKPVLVLSSKAVMEKLQAKQVEFQHLMIGILKHKTLEQLDDPDAANSIGREAQEMLNLKLDVDAGVQSVYFTQFVVQ